VRESGKTCSRAGLGRLLACFSLGTCVCIGLRSFLVYFHQLTAHLLLTHTSLFDISTITELVVITGASSGLGRKCALALLRSGEYHVVGAEIDGFDLDSFTPMQCELNSFDSVRTFCKNLDEFRMSKPIDRLICNAGVYQPSLEYAKWSKDNHEQTMQINFLSHFLMISQLMESMIDSSDPRVIMVGSVTGNDNTVGGGGVYPIADLHELDGFEAGFTNPISMADGYGFIGAKAYKDSKLCLMMTANYLHAKYHKLTGISFSSMYPGCIAESPLFREKRAWFRTYFPIFMKFITGTSNVVGFGLRSLLSSLPAAVRLTLRVSFYFFQFTRPILTLVLRWFCW
jgi:light-dependent protochlorophyllide reductase